MNVTAQAQPDWNLIQCFVTVVDAGSLVEAASLLSLSQPTLSRKISALETQIGAVLFERTGRGMRLTEMGKALLEAARGMQAAAQTLSLAAMKEGLSLFGIKAPPVFGVMAPL